MGLDFLSRVQRTTLILSAIVFVFVAVYHETMFALGYLIGATWSVANFWMLGRLIRSVLTPQEVAPRLTAAFAAVKFPVLYVGGYLLLRSEWFSPVALLSGFATLFLVVLLKALGRALLHLDDQTSESSSVCSRTR